jgi:MFS family permease
MRNALRVPGFPRLFTGLAASMFGDSLMLIVLGMWVKDLTGSNGAAGMTFLWIAGPSLLAPVFGMVVDRVSRRRFLVVGNLASALLLLPLLLVHDAGDVWIVYAVACCYGVSYVMLPAALNGLLKDMLPEDVLVEANAWLGITRQALRIVGPVSGAVLFAVAGGGAVAMVNAVTFVVAAAAVAGLRVRESVADSSREHQSWRAEVVEGASYIRCTPLLLHPTVAIGLALLVIGFAESAIYAVVEAFGRPVSFIGPMLTVQGVGAVLVGLVASRAVKRHGEPRTIVLGLVVVSLGLAAVTFVDRLWELLVGVAILGGGLPLIFVAFSTLLQKQTPSRLMGRVSASVEVFTTTPQALSIGVGALLVGILDYRAIFALMTVGTLAGAGYLAVVLRGQLGRTVAVTEAGETTTLPALPEPLSTVPPLPAEVVDDPRDDELSSTVDGPPGH